MKAINKIIYFLFAICLFSNSCTDEYIKEITGKNVIEGIPVTTTLTFQASTSKIVTRATAEEEDAVNDLYVLIFSESSKKLESSHYFSLEQLEAFGKNKIKLNATSGKKKVYAVANTGSNSFFGLKEKIDIFVSSSKKTLDDWKSFSITLADEQITWSGGHGTFTMSGYFVKPGDANNLKGDYLPGDGSCTFNTEGEIEEKGGKIQLVRLASQITFNIKNAVSSKGEFTPESWTVYNVPKSVYMNRQEEMGTPAEASFFTSKDGVFNQGSFNFYMLENRLAGATYNSPLKRDTTEMQWREAYNLSSNPKKYLNAPENGTYVVLNGTYKGKANNPFNDWKEGDAQASVTYYIHLGYVDRVDDFSIPRNAKYTYNITVASIDKIIVEVIDDNYETNPSDGHVMFYDAEIIDVDAHYERKTIKINCSVDEFLCGIQTPKTGFVYEDVKTYRDDQDIDWVQFMLKKDADKLNNKIDFRPGSKTAGLMNVKELADFIKTTTLEGEQDFYAYISENYYEDMKYTEFVNFEKGIGDTKSRKMMIAIKRSTTEHTNSSVSSSQYIIQQKPITTIFNLNDAAVKSGKPWGMEWINENLSNTYYTSTNWKTRAQAGIDKSTIRLPSNASAEDGLANTKSAITNSGIAWGHTDIDYSNYPHSFNAKAYAACMSRNRDENGNGKIDPEEIKWYLPANNQMQYLWIGLAAIPEEAALYPKDFRDANQWQFYHHVTSDSKVFWAEEGCAIGTVGNSSADRLHVRCARNIGDENKALLKIGTKTTLPNGDVTVEVGSRLPENGFRQKISSGKLSAHNEYGESNKVYKKIQIKNSLLSEYKDFRKSADAVYRSSSDPCAAVHGTGWRSPSQRELILMTTIGGFTGTSMHSVTYYSFWDYENNKNISYNPGGTQLKNTRIGFSFDGNILHLLTPDNTQGYGGGDRRIRCVKDID